jgi:hypothetical protein
MGHQDGAAGSLGIKPDHPWFYGWSGYAADSFDPAGNEADERDECYGNGAPGAEYP